MQVIAGRYELHRRIGAGGMGAVWLAYDRKVDDWVAVKLLAQRESAGLLRFVREQSLRIEHPHVVAPRGWAADDDQVALSMDLVRGGSLATLVGDHGPLPEPYVAVVVDQLLDALAAVHAHGVVHRDVTPHNVLLEPTGEGRPFARLSDFGIAALLDGPRLTEHGAAVGTVGYAAPEQLTQSDPDPRSDLYGLGILGRHLLTALPPDRLGGASDGPLWDVLCALSDNDIHHRPVSAAAARALVAPHLPSGMPWAHDPDAPCVFEHLDLPSREAAPTRIALPRKTTRPNAGAPQVAVDASPHAPEGDVPVEPAARHTGEGPQRGLSRNALRALAIGCFVLAVVLLVVLLVLLL